MTTPNPTTTAPAVNVVDKADSRVLDCRPMSYKVRNWERFQHYKDRNPPWIKLHFALLSSVDWVTLDDKARVLAVACMLIASRNHGAVPADPEYVKRVAYLNGKPDFNPLIKCGFLESASICEQALADASNSVSSLLTNKEELSEKEVIPAGLDLAVWKDWEAYRRGISKPIKPASRAAAMKKLASYGPHQAAVVEQSVAQGWTGLFDVKPSAKPPAKPEREPTPAEIAETRRRAAAEMRQQAAKLGLPELRVSK